MARTASFPGCGVSRSVTSLPRLHWLVWLLTFSGIGCKPDGATTPTPEDTDQPAVLFTSQELDFVHQAGGPDYFMPRIVGSGVAMLDFDGDNLLDLYLVQNAGPQADAKNQLYQQQADGFFANVSHGSGLDVSGFGMGAAVGDVNNDGLVDVLVTEYTGARLFLNQGAHRVPRFVESENSGIDNPLWATSAAMLDYDRDGWLDVVIVNYLNYAPTTECRSSNGQVDFCAPDTFAGRITKLYRNLGDEGDARELFEDVTASAGLIHKAGPGLGVYCADFNDDRFVDIFVANDGKPNHLWINQQDGRFVEEGVLRGVGYNRMGESEADMGVAIGDVDNDGLFDLFVTHLTSETHTLWQQGPPGYFQDRTAASGITASKWRGTGFGTVLADFDLDGSLDLAIANGRVYRRLDEDASASDFWEEYAEKNQILTNTGLGRFRDASHEHCPFTGQAAVSRGLACGDLNNDGRLDLVVARTESTPLVLLNQAGQNHHWLIVRAIDPSLRRDAYGAEVYLSLGARVLHRWINPAYSYLSSNDPRAHFGLGSVVTYDQLRIVWPDGQAEMFAGGPADRIVVVRKGEGATE